jgi:hypothetical protein
MADIGFKIQNELRKVEDTITVHELSKRLGISVDDIYTYVQDVVLPHYNDIYKKKAFKIPFYTKEQTKEFFSKDIVDIGFLVQYKIKEIKERLEKKLDTFAHQIFYNNWIMYRGY